MLLRRLVEFAETRMVLLPRLCGEAAVRYIVDLDSSGRLRNVRPTDTADPKSRQNKRGVRRVVPQIQRAVGITPLLLADKADYTFGLGGATAKPERVAACHAAYLDVLGRCAKETGETAVQAVGTFLTHDPVAQLVLPDDFDYGAIICFCVDGVVYPAELAAVQSFWAREHDPAVRDARVMQCVVCGTQRPVLVTLEGKVKRVPGGQMAGTAIISANAEAFESYGLERSLIAPTCADCGEKFTRALNELLENEHHRVMMTGAAFVFWTREPIAFDFGGSLRSPDAEQVQALISSVRSGTWNPDVDDMAFYATTLSASGARVVVRDWIDMTVGRAKANLAVWFEQQHVIGNDGDVAMRPLGVGALAGATARELKDVPTGTFRVLLRAALVAMPLPLSLLAQAVRRCRAEQGVTRPRAALIKLVLIRLDSSEYRFEEDVMVTLNTEGMEPAYLCGRLLAVLAEIQRGAIGKASLVDRFYGTASSAPASVFPRLLRGARPHLMKLLRDRKRTASALERRLEEVTSPLTCFPNTLSLKEQGLFALGFYHERAESRRRAEEFKAKKAAEC